MGAGNVKAVYGRWGHLPHQPFRVLAFMALTALDDASPPSYWGGHRTLATAALGRGLSTPLTESDYRAVRRAVAELERVGVVTVAKPSSPGRNASYLLNLVPTPDAQRPVNAGPSPSGERRTVSAGTPDAQRPERRTLSDCTPDAQRPPEEEQEEEGLTSGEAAHPSASPSGRACDQGHRRFTIDGDCLDCEAMSA